MHPENFAGYGEVSSHTRTLRIAAGEQLAGIAEFERLANEGRVHVLQPDLSRCGGLTVGRQIADLAMRRQIECVPHAWLTDLLNAASLHLNAYLMHSLYLGIQRLIGVAAAHAVPRADPDARWLYRCAQRSWPGGRDR